MARGYVCAVCLSTKDVEVACTKEDEDSLKTLKAFMRIPIAENDQMLASLCTACYHDLQLAYNFALQYEATFNKLRMSACLTHESVESNASRVKVLQKDAKEMTQKIIQEEIVVPADNTLIAEIVVKEEVLTDDKDKIECLVNKAKHSRSQAINQDGLEVFGASNKVSTGKVCALDSDNSNLNLIRWKPKSDDEDFESSEAELSLDSVIKDTSVKERTQLADKGTDKRKRETENCRPMREKYTKRVGMETDACEVSGTRRQHNFKGEENTKATSLHSTSHNECRVKEAFMCEKCDKRFLRKQSLVRHIITHSNPKCLTCFRCEKAFATTKALKEHEMLHSNPDVFKCGECDKRFLSKRGLLRHNILHSNPASLTCQQCEKSFTSTEALKQHEMLHLNPDAFKCDECGKKFKCMVNLRQHRITHSDPESLICEQCGKLFTTKQFLQVHRMLHSNPNAFKCDKCDKRFLYKRDLVLHSINHSLTRKCQHCAKSFATTKLLKLHLLEH